MGAERPFGVQPNKVPRDPSKDIPGLIELHRRHIDTVSMGLSDFKSEVETLGGLSGPSVALGRATVYSCPYGVFRRRQNGLYAEIRGTTLFFLDKFDFGEDVFDVIGLGSWQKNPPGMKASLTKGVFSESWETIFPREFRAWRQKFKEGSDFLVLPSDVVHETISGCTVKLRE